MAQSHKPQYVSFCAPINPKTAQIFLQCCTQALRNRPTELHIAFTTSGGDVQAGLHMYSALRSFPCKVVMYNVASVNSVGTIIFCAGEKRYASPNSSFLFHEVGFNIEKERLIEKTLLEKLASLRADQRNMEGILEDRTKIPRNDIPKLFQQQAVKTPDDSLKVGLIDEIRDFQVPPGTDLVQIQAL